MDLYSFFNSSTSYRVRIALVLKGLNIAYHGVNIRVGEQRDAGYIANINASASVPAIVDGDFRLAQSLAIIDWLDVTHPEPRLIPVEPVLRARVLEFANAIACDIHPVNNLRILKYLTDVLKVTPEQKDAWYKHWIAEGMGTVERLLAQRSVAQVGPWAFGAEPTLADICLVPQIANALRMDCDLSAFPRALAVFQHAKQHPAFDAAQPDRQPDYVQ
ncbi:maleylacetoacetate isomerase [Paraburkholderia xenovorans LB400]|uniref:Maleylacetoacetate isomerase n=1 Tax=Paraburkholderia xenovorans (strain LB400) TaxID=266265 RepID=Q13ZY5_PARXL|nr:maleylacetoacetate isomerase [Paraburkholderia xenovorans]ABE30324.1 Putative maleylpyruvate isomerase (MhbI) [Paraburkholderia xenovorans LB400]ABE30354.1 maleylacetoacetate isomerase [Paraburkholderia xenovorans LB400]AIP33629.1 maleylacetoacetate isomerase [Paraburkholderia xenovorans LB400]